MHPVVIDLASFRYIVSRLEDYSTVLEKEITLSLDLTESNDPGSCCGFNLSLPLKRGRVDIILNEGAGEVIYHNQFRNEILEIELNYEGNLKSNFDTAFRAAILADKDALN
jgi:hypothetical protein